jgi:hypothetical protein
MFFRRSALRRIPAIAVAMLWVAGPALEVIHDAHTAHVYCAEHGAFEDAGKQAGAAASSTAGSATMAREADGRSESHAACAFKASAPCSPAGCEGPDAAIVPRHPETELRPFASLHPSPIPLLSVAPKSSPPSA